MRIIGTGIDIVNIARIASILNRYGDRFLAHILHPMERGLDSKLSPAWVAGRFAVKEASAKALGSGFIQGIVPSQIAISYDELHKPLLTLHSAALARAQYLGAERFHVSLSHERDYAMAYVILEG